MYTVCSLSSYITGVNYLPCYYIQRDEIICNFYKVKLYFLDFHFLDFLSKFNEYLLPNSNIYLERPKSFAMHL